MLRSVVVERIGNFGSLSFRVADRSRLAEGTIFNYFETKEDIALHFFVHALRPASKIELSMQALRRPASPAATSATHADSVRRGSSASAARRPTARGGTPTTGRRPSALGARNSSSAGSPSPKA